MTERLYWLQKTNKGHFRNNINSHDICDWKAEGTDKQHKRSFPLSMVKDILSCFPKGGVVLDPFGGHGTTGVACFDMGFDAVVMEIDPDYYKASKQRLEDFMAQPKLDELVVEQREQLRLD
jgi:DNA modification methylase